MYKPRARNETIEALKRLYNEDVLGSGASYHKALMRNNTDMPFEAAAVAWRRYIACDDITPAAINAMRKFRDRWVDQGPEFVP